MDFLCSEEYFALISFLLHMDLILMGRNRVVAYSGLKHFQFYIPKAIFPASLLKYQEIIRVGPTLDSIPGQLLQPQ